MEINFPKKNATESYIPFCSKKCSDVDLMKWLSDEVYFNDKDFNR